MRRCVVNVCVPGLSCIGRRSLYFLGDWRPPSGPGGTPGGELIGTVQMRSEIR